MRRGETGAQALREFLCLWTLVLVCTAGAVDATGRSMLQVRREGLRPYHHTPMHKDSVIGKTLKEKRIKDEKTEMRVRKLEKGGDAELTEELLRGAAIDIASSLNCFTPAQTLNGGVEVFAADIVELPCNITQVINSIPMPTPSAVFRRGD